MGNHFHLAVATPQGNLVRGMQWLEETIANFFNWYRGEHGHLFQGRFKIILVEEESALGKLCHYIHLNPVQAGIVLAENLERYAYSIFWYLKRPVFLDLGTSLEQAGGLSDTPQGWEAYAHYLVRHAAYGPAGRTRAYVCLSRGWAFGSREFREALVKDHALLATARAWEVSGAEEIHRARWDSR